MSLPVRVRRAPVAILSALAVVATGLVVAAPAQAATGELFFSEYTEGSGFSKAIEIFNGTGADVPLSSYSLELYSNGSTIVSKSLTLSGSVTDGDVFVIAHQDADQALLDQADFLDTPSNVVNWNGNDAIVLRKGGVVVDSIGQVGGDPESQWGSGDASTENNTLRRKPTVLQGDVNTGDAFDPAIEWSGFANNTFDGFGSHSTTDADAAPRVASSSPANGATGVATGADVSLTFSEPVELADDPATISCTVSANHDYAVSGGGTSYSLNPAADFAFSEACTVTVAAAKVTDVDTEDPPNAMTTDHSWSFRIAAPPPSCDDPETHVISEVQGSDARTPVATTTAVTVKAVVTAIRPSLGGFFIHEELIDQDDSDSTSEGIFVSTSAPPADLAVGDLVQVTGGVRESSPSAASTTQISDRVTVLQCGVADVPAAAVLRFPVTEVTDFEHFEGMRVTMPQALVISEYFNFARFNEVVVGVPPNGRSRFDTPTAVQEPNVAATSALLADYAKRRITIDDGRGSQNSSPPIFPGTMDTPFTLDNTFRGGDTLTGITGVMEHTFGLYRVHPTEDATYAAVNPRPTDPPAVSGDINVASFNVLNYFLTLNNSANGNICSPGLNQECRGANDADELQRQRAKIVDAIADLDADVVGLMEMENTPGVQPAADLVDGLNAATAPGTYDYIDTGVIGTDAIRLGFLYKPGSVTPVGDFKVLDSSVDERFDDMRSRPALAQTFEQVGAPERFTVAVNHLKSKGSGCGAGDPDTGDGAGNCNLTRTLAAQALADWLATDPTSSGDSDQLIIGDLNSYDYEDPIDALRAAGYTDLVKQFGGEFAYGYVFDGLVGYLDHALANEALTPQVTGAAEWHINSDEPGILDYDTQFKGPNEDALYQPNAFRSSDHDAVLVGLDLGRCSFTDDEQHKVRHLDGDCSTDTTIGVPNGWTLDGDGHTITAYDGEGDHFRGAVVANEGRVASVYDLTVTGYQLADVCDADADRLRGILLDGASGAIIRNTVVDLRQEGSGCQEGNGIEVRNEPFAKGGRDVYVAITGNTVSGYQKGGIVTNGSVQSLIYGNTVRGLGPVPYIAQNGVQVGFGASAHVERNRIADNYYTGTADAESCGVLFYEADDAKQKKNTFSGNQRNVCTVKAKKVKKVKGD